MEDSKKGPDAPAELLRSLSSVCYLAKSNTTMSADTLLAGDLVGTCWGGMGLESKARRIHGGSLQIEQCG